VTTPAHHIRSYLLTMKQEERSDMSGHPLTRDDHDAGRCEIRLKGHLDGRWATWFDGLSLTLERGGITTIHGHVIDEAAFYGLLQKVRDVSLALISVTYVACESDDPPASPRE
jgi:hypothetical protein